VIVFFYCSFISVLSFVNQLLLCGGCRGRDHMVVGFTTTCVLSAYHHLCFFNLNLQALLVSDFGRSVIFSGYLSLPHL
jgi:hypothetical protein